MRAHEVTQEAPPPFHDEQQAIANAYRQIAQIKQIRAQIQQMVAARVGRPKGSLADEMTLASFRMYEAKFKLHQLWVQLQRLRAEREKSDPTMPDEARTAR
jgi:hypothetical protein